MEIFWWIVGLIWVAGWIRELASFHYQMERSDLEYPYEAVKWAMPVMLFFLWPYFYFYGKA